MFPDVQSKPPPAQLRTIPMRPISGYQGEELGTSLSLPLLRKLQGAMRSPLGLLFSKLDKPKVLSCSSEDILSRADISRKCHLLGYHISPVPLQISLLLPLFLAALFTSNTCVYLLLISPYTSLFSAAPVTL